MLPVQGSVSMLAGPAPTSRCRSARTACSSSTRPRAALVPQVLAEIRRLSDRPIRYLVNTSLDAEHIAGNAALVGPAAARGTGGAPFGTLGFNRPAIVAHENVLNRLSASQPPTPAAALPTTTYFLAVDGLQLQRRAGGRSCTRRARTPTATASCWFRRSDVLAVGDLVRLDRYPDIDVARGGSVDGLIAALDRIVEIAVPERLQDGGTRVVIRPRPAVQRGRRRRVSRHGGHHPRPRGGSREEGPDARAGEGRAADARLRHALRLRRRASREAVYRSLTEKRGTA